LFPVLKNMLPLTRYPYRGRIVPCPVCESSRFEHVASLDRRFKRLPTVTCSHCGLIYTNPMPDEDELARYYEKFYRFDYQLVTSGPTARHRRKRKAEAAFRIANVGDFLEPGVRTLDFGCGSGEFVEQMVAAGFDAHGFEPGEAYGTDARKRLGDRITVGRWQDMTFGPEFDLVTCFHVLEHLRNPLDSLSAITGWLKPGGLAYIEVPDLGGAPLKGIGSFHFAHVVGFNTWNLKLAAAAVGLAPMREFQPTGIAFVAGEAEDRDLLAARGRRMAREAHLDTPALNRYVGYQIGKFRR
jgi:SAM-dependent methyltransferase